MTTGALGQGVNIVYEKILDVYDNFLQINIYFDILKWEFSLKNNSLLVVFLSIFVADTKITFRYNFVASLSNSYEYGSYNRIIEVKVD